MSIYPEKQQKVNSLAFFILALRDSHVKRNATDFASKGVYRTLGCNIGIRTGEINGKSQEKQ
ncbi:MAG: hypothetical protein JEZ11_15230 [Desulfobacterales bacterium]|nr:hypothetical protein [Desulfobacterales bacterium]